MIERLTIDRFRALADAYGGVVARWPERDRAAASQMATEPDAAAILADALALDETLDAWGITAPASWLVENILATGLRSAESVALRVRLWWSGVGIAAALAGAVAGTAAVAMAPPIDGSPGISTSFGDVVGPDG